MNKDFIARASSMIDAPVSKVWDALTDPAKIKQYFFGTNVHTNWTVGSPITWKGEWQGKTYEDKGIILKAERDHLLQFTHFSPLSGQADMPENYHTITIELSRKGETTHISLSQNNNSTEQAREHSEQNWKMVLEGLKKMLEKSP